MKRVYYDSFGGDKLEKQDFNFSKLPSGIMLGYESGEDALLDIVVYGANGRTFRLKWETQQMIDEIKEPVIHNGVKLGLYYQWGGYIFSSLMGLHQFIGETEK